MCGVPQSNQRGIETRPRLPRLRSERPPQSNQRGIETRWGRRRGPRGSRLNRTSVGLKPRSLSKGERPSDRPQSNQRGIETAGGGDEEIPPPGPQSNQRGIETAIHHVRKADAEDGLNRTSVGLKREIDIQSPEQGIGLNRTSVGLKLAREVRGRWGRVCLNRTSVGLKLFLSYLSSK